MKLSFSIPSKPKSKSKPQQPSQSHQQLDDGDDDDKGKRYVTVFESPDNRKPQKQYVTVFDPSKPSSDSDHPPRVIPPMENEWRPTKRMKNLDLPLHSDPAAAGEISFEVETLSGAADGGDTMGYGLNLRAGGGEMDGDQAGTKPRTEDVLLDKLRHDLKRLPEDKGFEEFKEVPVEGFGAALLSGYGWHEGRGIGRNAKEDVKVREYKKRTAKEGLGFFSPGPEIGSDKNRELKGKIRGGDLEGDGFFVGKDVRVIDGKSNAFGLKGTIVERLDRDWVVLKLTRMGKEVRVHVFDVADLGSKEEEKCLKKLKELKIGKGKKLNGKDNEKTGSERRTERKENGNGESGGSEMRGDAERGIGWLRRHIHVRIISKDLKGGRLYLKKGEVVDVVGPYKCDISMDESRELVQGVDQDSLETVLPRRGGSVLILYGKHKGIYGNLVQRDLDREIGVVQDSDTHELVNVKLEQIAEYMGDPSYLGY